LQSHNILDGLDLINLLYSSYELLFVIVAGALGYFFAAKALRITEVSGITALILRRNKVTE
jgi:hypothetical protein